MLSYRHGFHAGNFADLLKHLVLLLTVEYLKSKPAPIRYIDTHAGAGLYDLSSAMSRKTGEFRAGVGGLDLTAVPPDLEAFAVLLRPFLASNRYPGSPLIAARLLRNQDELRLYELHPAEFPRLSKLFAEDRRVRVFNTDGFEALKAQLPAQKARALVLVDPSYELEADYRRVVETVREGVRRMPHAVYAIWYPVVKPQLLEPMLKKLGTIGGDKSLCVELRTAGSEQQAGMAAAGMFVLNAPWVLAGQLHSALAAVAGQLPVQAVFRRQPA